MDSLAPEASRGQPITVFHSPGSIRNPEGKNKSFTDWSTFRETLAKPETLQLPAEVLAAINEAETFEEAKTLLEPYKEGLPYYVCAPMEPPSRCAGNAQPRWVLGLDLDDVSEADKQRLNDALQPMAAVMHESLSNRLTSKHGLGLRLRVFLLLNRPSSQAEAERLWKAVNEHLLFGLCDVNARDVARALFVPAVLPGTEDFLFKQFEGAPLDVDAFLEKTEPEDEYTFEPANPDDKTTPAHSRSVLYDLDELKREWNALGSTPQTRIHLYNDRVFQLGTRAHWTDVDMLSDLLTFFGEWTDQAGPGHRSKEDLCSRVRKAFQDGQRKPQSTGWDGSMIALATLEAAGLLLSGKPQPSFTREQLSMREPQGWAAELLDESAWKRACELYLHSLGQDTVQPRRGFHLVGVDQIFATLPPIRWACESLMLAPGRPNLFVGYGASGKTMAAQAMLLATAVGLKVWGEHESRISTCVHLDYEQGTHATFRRYQRLAQGMGIDRSALSDRLRVQALPPVQLTDVDAEQLLCEAVRGADIVLIDSLRAACSAVDENDSKIRAYLDMLTRVSERTGAAFIVIHHAGKASKEDGRQSARGSSAIFDAAGLVLNFEVKAGHLLVSCVKRPASATSARPIGGKIQIKDMPYEGLAVVPVVVVETGVSVDHALEARVLDFVRQNPRSVKEKILKGVGGRRLDAAGALAQLEAEGKVYKAGKVYSLPEPLLTGAIKAGLHPSLGGS